MALSSNLFRGNVALEACAVEDSAHVTRGAAGDHVAKIQFALFELDGLMIDRTELVLQQYGPSTAAAVLAYKKRRQIINKSYQNVADDIVGKMTIASLDKEMKLKELLPKPAGDCVLSPAGVPGPSSTFSAAAATISQRRISFAGAKANTSLAPKQLGGAVRVFFAITLRSAQEDGYPLSASIERARDCLFEHGITLSVEIKNGFADTIRFPDRIISSQGNPVDNVDELRKASEDVRPGLAGILRVIVCQMAGGATFGETFRNRRIGGRVVPPFVLLNSQVIDRSQATLIHEMIHASKDGPVLHDPEPSSVFFEFGSEKAGNVERTVLKPEHAATLSRMSSKL
jgi:hypothetical protein